MGRKEQSYISSIPGAETIGEGGETVSYRVPGSRFVVKAFRNKDHKWKARGSKTASQRAEAVVSAGRIAGFSPPARRIDDKLIAQEYVQGARDAVLERTLQNGDAEAVKSTLSGLRRYHERGILLGDAALSNVLDQERTGYVTVDSTKWKRASASDDYITRDLDKLHREAAYFGRDDLLISSIESVYGKNVASQLRRAA